MIISPLSSYNIPTNLQGHKSTVKVLVKPWKSNLGVLKPVETCVYIHEMFFHETNNPLGIFSFCFRSSTLQLVNIN